MELLQALHPEDLPGERVGSKSEQEEREEEIVERIASLLDIAVTIHHSSNTAHCQMCGCLNDVHTAQCPVPILEDWISSR
jgi:hypothetical protein